MLLASPSRANSLQGPSSRRPAPTRLRRRRARVAQPRRPARPPVAERPRHGRVGRRQDREHQEGHPVPRREGRRPAHRGGRAGRQQERVGRPRRGAACGGGLVGRDERHGSRSRSRIGRGTSARAPRAADPRRQPDPRGVRQRPDGQEPQLVAVRQVCAHLLHARRRHLGRRHRLVPPREEPRRRAQQGRARLPRLLLVAPRRRPRTARCVSLSLLSLSHCVRPRRRRVADSFAAGPCTHPLADKLLLADDARDQGAAAFEYLAHSRQDVDGMDDRAEWSALVVRRPRPPSPWLPLPPCTG